MSSATEALLRPEEQKMADRGGGVRTIPLVSPGCGATQLINGITMFDPGAAVGLHWHNCEESVMVIEGDAVCVVDGREHALKTGDTTWLPPNLPHYFRNASTTKPMRIFWTYASAMATRTIASTGIEAPIAAEHVRVASPR